MMHLMKNFNTCRRQRQYVAPTDKPYKVDLSSLKIEADYVQFYITNLANDAGKCSISYAICSHVM